MLMRIVSLACIGNDKEGYEVNDAHYTGETVELSDNPTRQEIVKAMKDAGIMAKHAQRRYLTIDMDGGNSITVSQRRNSKPLWELQKP